MNDKGSKILNDVFDRAKNMSVEEYNILYKESINDITKFALLPCPFCGKQPETYWDSDDEKEGYNIYCCYIHISKIYASDAIDAWNTRKY